ncbi:MAG: ABC transporter permease [Halobacteriales archaeon]
MSRSQQLTVALRELASLRREKTIVLAILIQLFVAAFSSFLVVGLVSMYDPGAVDATSTTVGVAGDETDDLLAVAREEPGVRALRYETGDAAREAFYDGGGPTATASGSGPDAVVVTERLDDGTVEATVLVPDGSVRTTMAVVKLQELLQQYETVLRERRAASLTHDPVPVPPRAPASPYLGFTYTVLVPLLVFLPAFIGGSIAVDSVAEEIERGTMELLRVTPATLPQIVDGKLLAAAGAVPIQVALWIGLLAANGTPVANVPELLVFATAVGAAVVALGLGVAVATRNRRQAQFVYSAGILALFAASLLLPETPQNVVARLAIGSAGASTYASLAGTVAIAAATLVGVRWAVPRTNTDGL